MRQIIVSNLEEDVLARLQTQALHKGISMEQQLREILVTAARPSRQALLQEMDEIASMSPPLAPDSPKSEELIRKYRNANEKPGR